MSGDFSLNKWFEAAKSGNIRYIVQHKGLAMKGGAVPQDQIYPNNTALMYAAANNKKQCASILLATERSRQNKAGWSAMHWASYNNNIELVKLLKNFEAGLASTELYNDIPAQSTALQIAMQRGNTDIFNVLVTEEYKQSKLLQAHVTAFSAASFSAEIIEYMKRKVDADSIGRTPLHYLALNNQQNRNEEEYEKVFAALANIYSKETDVLGDTATMLAAYCGNKTFVTLMKDLENEASGSAEFKLLNNQGHSALMIASERPESPNNQEIIEILQTFEAAIQSPLGESALMCASRSNNVSAVEVLKKSELRLQTTSPLNGLPAGSTALMVAVQNSNGKCAEQLQDEQLLTNYLGQTASQLSQSHDHESESIVHTANPFAQSGASDHAINNNSEEHPQLLTTGELKRSELQTVGARCQECEYYKNEAEKRVLETNSLKYHISDLYQQLKLNNSYIQYLQKEVEQKSANYLALMQQIIRYGVKIDVLPSTVTIDYAEPENVPEILTASFYKVTDGVEQARYCGDVVQYLTDIIVELQKDVLDICTKQYQEYRYLTQYLQDQQDAYRNEYSQAYNKIRQLEQYILNLESERYTQRQYHVQEIEKLSYELRTSYYSTEHMTYLKEQYESELYVSQKRATELEQQKASLEKQQKQLTTNLEKAQASAYEKEEKIKAGQVQNRYLIYNVQQVLDYLRTQQDTLSADYAARETQKVYYV